MKTNQNLISKYLIPSSCILSLIALLLPFIEIAYDAYGYGSGSQTYTAYESISRGFGTPLRFILLAGPIFLLIMNFIKQTEKYRGIASMLIPVLCAIFIIVLYVQTKSSEIIYDSYDSYYDLGVDVIFKPLTGFYLLLIAYIGTIVGGAVTYFGITLDKSGLDKIKTEGVNVFKNPVNNNDESPSENEVPNVNVSPVVNTNSEINAVDNVTQQNI